VRLLDKLRLRLRSLFRRALVERELEAELRFHLDQLVEENIAAGLPPSEARAAALRTIGGMAQFQESCRDTRRLNLLEDLARDLQHALRVLRRSSGFTAVAVLTLALGIGATTAIFSVVYGVLLKPLPFSEPDRLVGVWHQPVRLGGAAGAIQNHGPATYFVYRDNNQVFEDLGAWDTSQVSVIGLGEPERVQALSVGEGTLPLLRVRPLLGRSFDAADVQPGGPPRVMLSHGYWQRRFGGAADVLGKRVVLDGVANEIIGVLPASFVFLRTSPALLQPLRLDRANIPNLSFGFQVLARLKPGVTLAQANADLARMIPLLPPAYGRYQLGPNVRPLVEDVTGNLDRILWILMATVGFVLLIACANVANLFLVRAEGRHRELAVRAVLGASRGRIARQLVAESLVLTLAGGLVGLMLAQLALGLVRRLAPVVLPRIEDIGIDGVVLLFTLALALLAAVAFGLVPVLRLGASNAPTLKEGGRPASEGRRRQRARNALVVAQVAMALVLLIGSGLMIRTFVALWQVHPGFVRPEAVQTFRIRVPRALAAEQEQMVRTHDRIAQRLRQVAGVQSVGLASSITLDGEDNMNPIFVEHVHAPYQKLPPHRRFKSVGPG
jgi:putative ABC transport system permease protein